MVYILKPMRAIPDGHIIPINNSIGIDIKNVDPKNKKNVKNLA